MHELALTCSIVEMAEEAAEGRPVARLTIVIGRLSGVMTEAQAMAAIEQASYPVFEQR